MVKRILSWRRQEEPGGTVGLASKQPNAVLEEVISYLRSGRLLDQEGVLRHCLICGMRMGNRERTDGELRWPDQVEHYIIAHHVWTPEHEALAHRVVYGSDIEMPDAETLSDYDGEEPLILGDSDFDLSGLMGDEKPEEQTPMPQPGSSVPDRFSKALQQAHRRFGRHPGIRAVSGPPTGSPLGIHFVVESQEAGSIIPPKLWRFPTHVIVRPSPLPLLEVVDSVEDLDAFMGHAPFKALPGSVSTPDVQVTQDSYGGTDFAGQIAAAYPRAAGIAHKIVDVARHVGAHPFDLANQIGFESAWSFSPSIQYGREPGMPFQEGIATGLIQFIPPTARELGTTTRELFGMSAAKQMEYVEAYLDLVRRGRPLDTPYKLAMAIFYRPAIDWNPQQRFPAKVTEANPQVHTPQDYMRALSRRKKLPSSIDGAPIPEPEEPGALAQFQSWFTNLFTPPEPMPQPPSVDALRLATWTVGPGLTLRLVGGGNSYEAGAVPPGPYELQQFNGSSWIAMSPVRLDAGQSYRAWIEAGRVKWAVA